jgi:ubiquinone/menaquinone biosynthesis C-methylase UbiE
MNDEIVYDRHEEEWDECLNNAEKNKVALTWLNQNDTLDRWRHNRTYQIVKPIIKLFPFYQWLTVGDGRYGTDGNALNLMGAKDVFCTDISDSLLKIGNSHGLIGNYAAENAEKLSFEKNRFDFVFCKESYHHFPRPHIALHEMLRVCRVGVVLIEPDDQKISRAPLRFIVPMVKKLLGRKVMRDNHSFEPVGNYVFSISKREIEKIQLGMHRRYVAFNYINDYYEPGFEFIDLNTKNKSEKIKILKTKCIILFRDLLCRVGLVSPGLLASILFKDEPDQSLLIALKNNGWDVVKLPKNPFV